MIIACPSCEARYRIDDARAGSAGARLRCARCRSLFRLPEHGAPHVAPASLSATLKPSRPDSRGRPTSRPPACESGPSQVLDSKAAVLLADPDSGRAAEFVKRMATQGLHVDRAADGVQALLGLQRAHYPVVILTGDLPRIGAGDLCEIIRGTEALKSTGLVLLRSKPSLSGLSSSAQGEAAFDLEIDEADPDGGLIAFLQSHGLRVKPPIHSESRRGPVKASPPEQGEAEVSVPSVPHKTLTGEDAERAKAERLARIVVSDMLLYHPERFDQVDSEGGLLDEFAPEIREGGLLLSKRVDPGVLSERDYLGDELRRAARQRAGA